MRYLKEEIIDSYREDKDECQQNLISNDYYALGVTLLELYYLPEKLTNLEISALAQKLKLSSKEFDGFSAKKTLSEIMKIYDSLTEE